MDEYDFWSAGLSNVIEAFTALTTLSATGAAWWGIWSWKRQKIWDHSVEVGRAILEQTYEYEAKFENALSPFYVLSEIQRKVDLNVGSEDEISASIQSSLSGCVDALLLERKSLIVQLQKASTIWPEASRKWIKHIEDLDLELNRYLTLLNMKNVPSAPDYWREVIGAELGKYREIIRYPDPQKNIVNMLENHVLDDSFRRDFVAAFKEFRDVVRNRMNLPS